MTDPLHAADAQRRRARELAASFLSRGDEVGWFEPLYAEAGKDPACVPWADLRPNPNLLDWLAFDGSKPTARSALVVGCGLGDDAEHLAHLGFRVTAFDVAPSAIAWCRRRFPNSAVSYEVADVLNLPSAWAGAFDFVFEAYTLQVLPPRLRPTAMLGMAAAVRPAGLLLAICRARNPEEPEGQMPWPLLCRELQAFVDAGLIEASFEDYLDRHEDPPVRRIRAAYTRPSAGS